MLAALLGWAVVTSYVVGVPALLGLFWLSIRRPWWFRPRIPVPRETPELEWVVPYQDKPIPWI